MALLFILPFPDMVLSGDDIIIKPKRVIGAKKVRVAVIWNRHGFDIIDLFSDGATFNTIDFFDNIVTPLQSRIFQAGRKTRERKFSFHLGNCSIGTVAQYCKLINS
jgi:hypothetical protein